MLGFIEELLGEAELVLVDLLGSELREDAAEVAFERVLGDQDDLRPPLAEKPFEGVVEKRLVAGDSQFGDAGDNGLAAGEDEDLVWASDVAKALDDDERR